MLQALAEAVKNGLRKELRLKSRMEGDPDFGWVLIDAGDIIVHIFGPRERAYYNLEALWAEGKILLQMQ